ncbi:hypothetical protein [Anaerococcus degeneri]|uniref:Uncharacterized protein n=1 Tax=Anaerococcus degeneri TaxID=361500 RepID=A0ABS7YX34_9FIRM|nr:hypothetical protein [Anaerococcus degeneri]MBP2015398.1 uncharacterized protein YjgD (DUF1641 family) [Anaerococcus degeneri]MCA2096291.1 hypothetical protein [Anaerococcus degeneri]
MTYKEIKENIEKYAKENYKDLIKAIISLESPETSEKTLDEIYEYYMENDGVYLLSEEIREKLANN